MFKLIAFPLTDGSIELILPYVNRYQPPESIIRSNVVQLLAGTGIQYSGTTFENQPFEIGGFSKEKDFESRLMQLYYLPPQIKAAAPDEYILTEQNYLLFVDRQGEKVWVKWSKAPNIEPRKANGKVVYDYLLFFQTVRRYKEDDENAEGHSGNT